MKRCNVGVHDLLQIELKEVEADNLEILIKKASERLHIYKTVSALRMAQNIVGLDFSSRNLSDLQVYWISSLLESNVGVKNVSLNSNDITAFGASKLFTALFTSKSLLELSLKNNKITEECFAALSFLLEANVSIVKIDLSGNAIRNAAELKKALRYNHTVIHLGIKDKFVQEVEARNTKFANDIADLCEFLRHVEEVESVDKELARKIVESGTGATKYILMNKRGCGEEEAESLLSIVDDLAKASLRSSRREKRKDGYERL